MKISRVQIESIIKSYESQVRRTPSKQRQEENVPMDKVDISSDARLLMKLKEAVANHPDIREDLVAEIKRQIGEGSYHVDAKEVADKMVSRALADVLACKAKTGGLTMEDQPWERFIHVLGAQAELCSEMATLGKSKTGALIAGELSNVELLVKAEQALIGKAMGLEQERQIAEQQIIQLLGIEPANMSLPMILDFSPEEYSSRLKSINERLTSSILEIGRLNETNSKLIRQCLRYVDFILNQISLKSGKPYHSTGTSEFAGVSSISCDVKA